MPASTRNIGFLNKARVVSSCPFDVPLLAMVNEKNQLLMITPGKKEQLLWCIQLQHTATFISWSPDLKYIAVGPELRILSVETGLETKGPVDMKVRWLKWLQCGGICLLAVQEAESNTIKFIIEGNHAIVVATDNFSVQDMDVSYDLSKLFILDTQSVFSSCTTGWTRYNIESLRESLTLHRASSLKEEAWKSFVESVKKYGIGVKWAIDKLRSTEPSGHIEAALLALALLTDSPDNEHLSRLKSSTTTRDAYKYRDQLVRCYEDMRKKFEALGLGIKAAEPFTGLLDNIEKQSKDFLSWFLSLFSANSDSSKTSLSTIVDALTAKDVNTLKGLSEACLKRETTKMATSSASMEHLKQIQCSFAMQEKMSFDSFTGVVGALKSGTAILAGLDETRTQLCMWVSDGSTNIVTRSKAIDRVMLTKDQTLNLVFVDGSVEYLNIPSLSTLSRIELTQTHPHSTSDHIRVLCEDTGHLTVL